MFVSCLEAQAKDNKNVWLATVILLFGTQRLQNQMFDIQFSFVLGVLAREGGGAAAYLTQAKQECIT